MPSLDRRQLLDASPAALGGIHACFEAYRWCDER
jgi:hypothetical protein